MTPPTVAAARAVLQSLTRSPVRLAATPAWVDAVPALLTVGDPLTAPLLAAAVRRPADATSQQWRPADGRVDGRAAGHSGRARSRPAWPSGPTGTVTRGGATVAGGQPSPSQMPASPVARDGGHPATHTLAPNGLANGVGEDTVPPAPAAAPAARILTPRGGAAGTPTLARVEHLARALLRSARQEPPPPGKVERSHPPPGSPGPPTTRGPTSGAGLPATDGVVQQSPSPDGDRAGGGVPHGGPRPWSDDHSAPSAAASEPGAWSRPAGGLLAMLQAGAATATSTGDDAGGDSPAPPEWAAAQRLGPPRSASRPATPTVGTLVATGPAGGDGDPETLADLVAVALAEQARRHGVELP